MGVRDRDGGIVGRIGMVDETPKGYIWPQPREVDPEDQKTSASRTPHGSGHHPMHLPYTPPGRSSVLTIRSGFVGGEQRVREVCLLTRFCYSPTCVVVLKDKLDSVVAMRL